MIECFLLGVNNGDASSVWNDLQRSNKALVAAQDRVQKMKGFCIGPQDSVSLDACIVANLLAQLHGLW